MKTFLEFVEDKKIEKIISETANLFVELDIEPTQYVLEYVSKTPEVEACLLEYIDYQENIFKAMGQTASNVWNAAKQVGKGMWSGGGLKHGLTQAKDTLTGPSTKFDYAVKVMKDLVASLMKDEKFRSIPSSAHPKFNIVQYLQQLTKNLERESANIPKMADAKVTPPEMTPRG